MAKTKAQSPVVEQVINAYASALETNETIPEDTKNRLIEVLLAAASPNTKRISDALFPSDEDEQ